LPTSSEATQLAKALADEPPERWLDKIAELRRGGKLIEADELLAAFKQRFPEHPAARSQ
jgi:hypothetical protein